MKLAEAREFLAGLEEVTGWSFSQMPTNEADQAVASLRDDLREIGVDTNDEQQMLCVFAGLMCGIGALSGGAVTTNALTRLTAVSRAILDWKGDTGANLIPDPEPERKRRWWRR